MCVVCCVLFVVCLVFCANYASLAREMLTL